MEIQAFFFLLFLSPFFNDLFAFSIVYFKRSQSNFINSLPRSTAITFGICGLILKRPEHWIVSIYIFIIFKL